MPFALFYDLFPDIAPTETRSVIVQKPGELPVGTYGFLEMFCDEEGCDCRRAFIDVRLTRDGSPPAEVAMISYGWEDESFYRKWARYPLSPEDLHELKGPALVRLTPQSEYAGALLEVFETMVGDETYAARIQRHYAMYRRAIDEKHRARPAVVHARAEVGRNDPCPCGSGKKLQDLQERNEEFFEEEVDKLERWAEDVKFALERELRELDTQIKAAKKTPTSAVALAEKLEAQKLIKTLEADRNTKRRQLFEAQDEVDRKRAE